MSVYDVMNWLYGAYVALLALACGAAAVQRWADIARLWKAFREVDPIRRTAAVLALNVAVNAVFISVTDWRDCAPWFFVIDAVSAFLVLYPPAGRAQALVGSVYIAQILMHLVYMLSDHSLAANRYWQVLFGLAALQLIIFGGWLSGHLWGLDRVGRGGGAGLAHPHGTGRVAK